MWPAVAASPRRRLPLMKFTCCAKCYLRRSTGPIEFARSRLGLGISTGPARSSSDAVPDSLATVGSSFLQLQCFCRVRSHSFLSTGFTRRNSLPEVSGPIRDISVPSPLGDGFLKGRLRSAHSVSRAHDGLLLCTPCGFVSPHYHVRDSLPGCSPDSCPT